MIDTCLCCAVRKCFLGAGPLSEMREENPACGVILVSHFSYKGGESRQIRPQDEFSLKWYAKERGKI